MKAHKSTNIDAEVDFTNVSDEFNSDSDTEIKENSGPMPVFEDLKNHVVSPFVQLTDEFMDLEWNPIYFPFQLKYVSWGIFPWNPEVINLNCSRLFSTPGFSRLG